MVRFYDLRKEVVRFVRTKKKVSVQDIVDEFGYSYRVSAKNLNEFVRDKYLVKKSERGRFAVGNTTCFYKVV